jgi:hypothetical protein
MYRSLVFTAVFVLVQTAGMTTQSAAETPRERHLSPIPDKAQNPGWLNLIWRGEGPARTDTATTKFEVLQQQFGESVLFQTFVKLRSLHQGLNGPKGGTTATSMDTTSKLNTLSIEGFEKIDRFSNDALRATLSAVYTETFLRNSLGGIRYLPHEWAGTAASVRDIGYVQMNIFFSPGEGDLSMTKERALYLIQHELGHANDWNHSTILTSGERIAMLFEITARFAEPDHYRGYHESLSILYDGSNLQNNYYQMVREYWADLAREYVRNPDVLRSQYPKDYALVETWFRRLSGDIGVVHLVKGAPAPVHHAPRRGGDDVSGSNAVWIERTCGALSSNPAKPGAC